MGKLSGQLRIWEMPQLTYVDEFPIKSLPGNDLLGGDEPDKNFIKFISDSDGGLVPVFIQGKEGYWKILHGGETVKAARAAELASVSVLLIPEDVKVDPAIFLAYDKHGQMTLQEKVTEIMRLASEDDLTPIEIAKRVCLPPSEVKYCLRLGSGNAQIVRAWLAKEVSTGVLKETIKRTSAEQAELAERLEEEGSLTVDNIKEYRAKRAKDTARMMRPMWQHPDFGNHPTVLNANTTGDGVSVELTANQETTIFKIPMDRLLQLKEEFALHEEA